MQSLPLTPSSKPMSRLRAILVPLIISIALVLLLDGMTNEINVEKLDSDFQWYIALSEQGFRATPLISPFAYRYANPFLVGGLRRFMGIPTRSGFELSAYLGATLQLFGVFLLVLYVTKSRKSAYIALLVTALSLFNIKFLLFDPYRPDHFAYASILLAFYFCLTNRFYLLLIVTAIGLQFREFVVVPLLSHMMSLVAQREWKILLRKVVPFLACIFLALVLPRWLIPVTRDVQYVKLSGLGLVSAISVPFNAARDFNFLFCVLAYSLPTLMLLTLPRLRLVILEFSREMVLLLAFYTIFVLVFSLFGGSDLMRFMTYLFLPQALLVASLSRMASRVELVVMLIAVFIFNRLWLPFPAWDSQEYLDFYGGWAARLNWATAWRWVELLSFLVLAIATRQASRRLFRLTINA